MSERPDLGSRKSAVLRAIVEEYVRSSEPVGSETVAEHAGLGVSSATIRNEMAALEELGYLSHPHTSAGRIPTDLGYRQYVDSLPVGGRLGDTQRRAIAGYFAEAILDLEEVLKGSVQLLSRLTQYAGLAVPPAAREEPIVRLELIDMGPTVLILAVGNHGRVDKRIFDRPKRITPKVLRDAEARLQPLRGKTYLDAQAELLRLAAEGPTARARPDASRGRDAADRVAGRARFPRGGRRSFKPRGSGANDAPRHAVAVCSRRWSVKPRCFTCFRTCPPRARTSR